MLHGLFIAGVVLLALILAGALTFLLVEWAGREDDPNPTYH